MMCPSSDAFDAPCSVLAATVQNTTCTPSSHSSQTSHVVGSIVAEVTSVHGTSVAFTSCFAERHTASVYIASNVAHGLGPPLQLLSSTMVLAASTLPCHAKSGSSSNAITGTGRATLVQFAPPAFG